MKKLTEQECLDIGGHCWNYFSANDAVDEFGNSTGIGRLVYYPDGEPRYRKCKHCRKTEREIPSRWE